MQHTKHPEEGMISKKQLLKRGWSEKLITKHLGEPDLTRRNCYNIRSGDMKFWSLDRVLPLEELEEFKSSRALKRQRSEKIRQQNLCALKQEKIVGIAAFRQQKQALALL